MALIQDKATFPWIVTSQKVLGSTQATQPQSGLSSINNALEKLIDNDVDLDSRVAALEGSGGTTTFIGLTDTPGAHVSNQVLTNNGSGIVFEAKNTGFNKNFGTIAGTVAEGNHIHDDRYYTETELNTSGAGGQVHIDNIVGGSLGGSLQLVSPTVIYNHSTSFLTNNTLQILAQARIDLDFTQFSRATVFITAQTLGVPPPSPALGRFNAYTQNIYFIQSATTDWDVETTVAVYDFWGSNITSYQLGSSLIGFGNPNTIDFNVQILPGSSSSSVFETDVQVEIVTDNGFSPTLTWII